MIKRPATKTTTFKTYQPTHIPHIFGLTTSPVDAQTACHEPGWFLPPGPIESLSPPSRDMNEWLVCVWGGRGAGSESPDQVTSGVSSTSWGARRRPARQTIALRPSAGGVIIQLAEC